MYKYTINLKPKEGINWHSEEMTYIHDIYLFSKWVTNEKVKHVHLITNKIPSETTYYYLFY